MKKTALFTVLLLPTLLPAMAEDAPVTAAGFPAEGKLEPFLGEPHFEIQRLFGGERLPNLPPSIDSILSRPRSLGDHRVVPGGELAHSFPRCCSLRGRATR